MKKLSLRFINWDANATVVVFESFIIAFLFFFFSFFFFFRLQTPAKFAIWRTSFQTRWQNCKPHYKEFRLQTWKRLKSKILTGEYEVELFCVARFSCLAWNPVLLAILELFFHVDLTVSAAVSRKPVQNLNKPGTKQERQRLILKLWKKQGLLSVIVCLYVSQSDFKSTCPDCFLRKWIFTRIT